MIVQTWGDALWESFNGVWAGVADLVPRLVVAIIIFVAGWVVGTVVGRLVAQIVSSIKVDNMLRSLGAEEVLSRAGIKLDSGAFIGALIKWFVIVVFLIASIDVLGLSEVNSFLREVVVNYLPNVIAAAIILVLAAVIAEVIQGVVVSSARAAGMPSAGFLGGVSRWAIWVFAILAALYQLGIAAAFVQTLFTGFVALLALAGGLAFGLGGKEAATRFLERMRRDISER